MATTAITPLRPARAEPAPVSVTVRAYPTLAQACAIFYAKRGCGCGRCGS